MNGGLPPRYIVVLTDGSGVTYTWFYESRDVALARVTAVFSLYFDVDIAELNESRIENGQSFIVTTFATKTVKKVPKARRRPAWSPRQVKS